jgi:hypothetical protein
MGGPAPAEKGLAGEPTDSPPAGRGYMRHAASSSLRQGDARPGLPFPERNATPHRPRSCATTWRVASVGSAA